MGRKSQLDFVSDLYRVWENVKFGIYCCVESKLLWKMPMWQNHWNSLIIPTVVGLHSLSAFAIIIIIISVVIVFTVCSYMVSRDDCMMSWWVRELLMLFGMKCIMTANCWQQVHSSSYSGFTSQHWTESMIMWVKATVAPTTWQAR